MRRRFFTSLARLGFSLAAASLILAPLAAQAPQPGRRATAQAGGWKAPRTADGQPDLQGVWANNSATPLERPKELAGRERLTPEEMARVKARAGELFNSSSGDAAFGDEIFVAALSDRKKYVADSFDKDTGNYNSFWLVDRDFDNRTSLIVDPPDGRVPPVTPQAEGKLQQYLVLGPGKADSHEDRPYSERCITFGIPDLLAGYNSYYQIAQSKDHVAIYTERIHDTRIIPLDGRPHVAQNVRLWNGDSRGRWEGDTLVVDTTNFSSKTNFRGSAENFHMVERFTRVTPDTVAYEVTVSDLTTWTKPWTFMIPLKKSSDKIYEYACHEGNTGMFGVLNGARVLEKTSKSGGQ